MGKKMDPMLKMTSVLASSALRVWVLVGEGEMLKGKIEGKHTVLGRWSS